MAQQFLVRTDIAAPAREVFAWHARPGAFERLVPPWESVRVIARQGGIEEGATTVLEMRVGPVPLRWTARHLECVPGVQFVDEQEGGPFSAWRHTHRFLTGADQHHSVLEDDIRYVPPLGAAGRLADRALVRPRLRRTFRYRHATTRADIETQRRYAGPAMRIAVTGASGLIGSQLVPFLTTAGHEVVRILRGPSAGPGTAGWDVTTGALDEAALGHVDAVVHLAGAGIADQRWSPSYKREIRDSRVGPTRALSEWLAARPHPPSVLACASAIGYYGDRGDEALTEASAPGQGFLPEVCTEWERTTQAAQDRGIRVVHLRTGIVLTPKGGALKKMLPAFLAGVGGPVGTGRQWMSWISIDDLIGAAYHAMATPALAGPVNLTAPAPVTSAEFSATLARVLRRPAVVRVPAFAIRALFGEMGEDLLLDGQRVLPGVLQRTGYTFRHPRLEDALRHLLGR
jgi:hypothetical protein